MVEHSGNHLPLCAIHESGWWWDLTYWSSAEYWYDLACLSICREVVTVSLMKILVLCSLLLSSAWKARKYWYENCKYLGSIPNTLQFSPSRSIQAHHHYLFYENACSHDVPTECPWVLNKCLLLFICGPTYLWVYRMSPVPGLISAVWWVYFVLSEVKLGSPCSFQQDGSTNHCISGDIQAIWH